MQRPSGQPSFLGFCGPVPKLAHHAEWRGIPATGKQVEIKGYRAYRLEGNKIVEHWALIDGDSLERQLRAAN